MKDIYDSLVEGICAHKPASLTDASYLQSLQPSVRLLRKAYLSSPVSVSYKEQDIQAAYLATYLPHYYQLIHSILLNDSGALFEGKSAVNLGFIGGGPGSEVYGAVKFILNNCKWVKEVKITVFDINAETWKFSHGIVLDHLIRQIPNRGSTSIEWNALQFDLVNEKDVASRLGVIKSLDLLVIQNCINEIASKELSVLERNVVALFAALPSNSYFLISDLTSVVRNLMRRLEQAVEGAGGVQFKRSTLGQANPTAMISVHHRPNRILLENLLMYGVDGLMPKKNLKYDYIAVEGKS